MAAVRTGTASQVNASAGDGSTSVTVPGDATGAVAFVSHWDGDGGSTLSTLTLGGNSFSFFVQDAEGPSAMSGLGVATLTSIPGTGSQTLAWTWSAGGARTEGGVIVVVWIKDYNTGDPVRDADINSNFEFNGVSVTIDSASDDLVLAYCHTFEGGGRAPVLSPLGTTFIDGGLINNHRYDAAELSPGASTTTADMTDEYYAGIAAVSIKAGSTGVTREPGKGTLTFAGQTPTATQAMANDARIIFSKA